MSSPPRPPVRRTSRHSEATTFKNYAVDFERSMDGRDVSALLHSKQDMLSSSDRKKVGFSRGAGSSPGSGLAERWRDAATYDLNDVTYSNGKSFSGNFEPLALDQPMAPNGGSPPTRGDSRALQAREYPDYRGVARALGTGAILRPHLPLSSSVGFFDRLAQFVDFDSPADYDENEVDSRQRVDLGLSRSPVKRVQRKSPQATRDLTHSIQSTMSRWSALISDDRAMALLSMTQFARADLYRSESRKIVTQAICTAVAQDPCSNPRLLLELDPEGRADVLSYLSISQRCVSVAGMQFEDRIKTLHQMPAEHIGPALANLATAEVLKTFKGLDGAKRPSVFADLEASARTAVLAWTPVKSRMDLLAKLGPADRAAILLSLPMKECCSTIRVMSPFHAECVLLEMTGDSRGQVLSAVPERDLSAILLGMPVDKQVSVLDGLGPQAMYHAFRCIPAGVQAILFHDLPLEDSAGVVDRMSPKERAALVAALPPNFQAKVLRMLEPKDATVTLRTLDKDDAVAALEELNAVEQAEMVKCMSGKDRGAVLARMQPYQRAAIIGEMPFEERMVFFRNLNLEDLAKTLSEMTPEENLDALSCMNSSERAEVFSAMSSRERTGLALMMKPELLASALAEMDAADGKELVNALPADAKALVLCSMPEAARAIVLRSIMPNDLEAVSNVMRQGRDGEFLDTMRNMGPEALNATLEEMSQRDTVSLLLLLPIRERARVLEHMTPLECAEILDCFLLEDRANTMGAINTSKAALVLTEIHPYKKAILLAAVGERERLAIMEAMTPQDIGGVLSALPPADSVTTLRTLDAARGAQALGHMVPEERAITIEALPTKDRAAILSQMEPDQAAYCLSRLGVEECGATLRLFKDEPMKAVLNEIPSKVRAAALLACPVKFRVHALGMLSGVGLAAFLEALDHMEFTGTVKNLLQPSIEAAMPHMSLDIKVKVIACISAPDAARVVQKLAAPEKSDVLQRLPIESCAGVLKGVNDDCIYATLTNMDRRDRLQLVAALPEALQTRISKIILPPPPSPAQGHQQTKTNWEEVPRHAEPAIAMPLVIPVRRPASVSPPRVSPGKAPRSDVAVTVSMKFDEDYDWLTADEHRKTSWSEWLRGIVCNSVKVSPKRLHVADLQRGSVCLLLRCLPLSETPTLGGSDDRSAMELALQVLAFASDKAASSKLPKFLGGMLHSLGDKPPLHADRLMLHAEAQKAPSSAGRSQKSDASLVQENCGVGIAFAPTPDGQYLSVIGMIPGGDADRSGLIGVGDVVSSIDAQAVKNMPIPRLAQRIRGPTGTRIQIGFKSLSGGSEKNMDLVRIPATTSSPSPMRRPSSSSNVTSWDPNAVMPVHLSFLGDQPPVTVPVVRSETRYDRQEWHLHTVPDAPAPHATSASPHRSPGEGKVLRSLGSPMSNSAHSAHSAHQPLPAMTQKAPAATHDIWGTLEQLDASIQRRNSDMKSFTQSLLKLQADSRDPARIATSPPSGAAPLKSAFELGVGDFFYA